MPKYFVDVTEDGRRSEDQEGLDFPDRKAAVQFAWNWLMEVLRDFRLENEAPAVDILLRDESGQPIYQVTTTGRTLADEYGMSFSPPAARRTA